ncbi:MAG: hypothetical protein QG671_1292 [Actinomycetota bacterium]|nr:hypothetical protein [Actinomycetota bacterium]
MPVTHSAETLFTRYGPAELDGLREELLHLRTLDRAGCGSQTGTGRGLPAPGSRVLTARVGSRLAGYVAGFLSEVIDVRDVVVAPAARRSRPDLAGELVEQFVEDAGLPWADVVMPRDGVALAHLISTGWSPVTDRAAEDRCAVRLSAARGLDE